jgi:monoamine oxidase
MPVREADVAIVGAGLAGLTVACELDRLGASTVVLEARERVGGRVLSQRLEGGVALDQGGQFVGPPREGPWRIDALCRRFGIERFATPDRGDKVVVVGGRRRRYGGLAPTRPWNAALDLVRAKDRLERLAGELPPGAPWQAEQAHALDAQTYAGWIERNVRTRQARALLRMATQTLYAAEPERISLLHALAYVRSTGRGHLTFLARVARGQQQEQIRGGAQTLALALAGALGERVALAAAVRRVEVAGGRVTLTGPDVRVACRRAVIALPPALAGELDYVPSLPAARTLAARAFRGGSVIAISIVYARPHWRERGLSGYAASTEGPVRGVLDVTPPGAGCGVLQAFAVADEARALARLPAPERRAAVLGALAALLGAPAREPELYAEKDWSADPWTRGCYHGIGAPRAWSEHGPALRASVGPLHWACSETATWGLGTMEGAVDAGRRAALEVAAALEAERQPSAVSASAAARRPDSTAPLIEPIPASAVSVPAQCSGPTGGRSQRPSVLQAPGAPKQP